MDLFTGKRRGDREIWLRGRKNWNEDKQPFVLVAAYERQPDQGKLHPLERQYQTIFDFMQLTVSPLTLVRPMFREKGFDLKSEARAHEILNATWNSLTDAYLISSPGGAPCDFSTASSFFIRLDCDDEIYLRCWKSSSRKTSDRACCGEAFKVLSTRTYMNPIEKPKLLGGYSDALINATTERIQELDLEIGKHVQHENPLYDNISALQQQYERATDDKFVFCDSTHAVCTEECQATELHYYTGLKCAETDEEVILIVKRNNEGYRHLQPWSLEVGYWVTDTSDKYPGVKPANYLTKWAEFGKGRNTGMSDMVSDLARMAIEEPWSFKNDGSNSILGNYIRHTVARLLQVEYLSTRKTSDQRRKMIEQNGKPIAYNDNKRVALINTGLYSKDLKQLLLVFCRDGADDRWRYVRVDTVGSYDLLNKVKITNWPAAPVYWDSSEELVYPYDYSRSPDDQLPHINMDHVMNRLERLPKVYLEKKISDVLHGTEAEAELLALLAAEEVDYPQLQTRCREYPEIRRQVEHDLKEQVRNALIRQHLNFRHIVPTYSPATEDIGFLIPLRMCGDNVPDTAMVVTVEMQDNRRREECTKVGRTLLTMDMAYNNSRLLCKPESEWLNPADIIKPSEEDLLDVFEVELRIDD